LHWPIEIAERIPVTQHDGGCTSVGVTTLIRAPDEILFALEYHPHPEAHDVVLKAGRAIFIATALEPAL
jgi:hypothetical protein